MVERHKNISFAGGALVFPGGRIDAGDSDPRWIDCAHGLNEAPDDQYAPRVAAIREAFEETGVLLARRQGERTLIDDDHARSLGQWRKPVEKDDAEFLRLIMREGLELACDALHLFARWSPPRNADHRRYDTWFFAAKAPVQEAREDGEEATEIVWFSPQEALAANARGERKLIFPTLRNIELLGVSDSADAAIDFAGRRKIERIQARRVKREDGVYVTIPAGMGYPVTEQRLDD